jgi:hypothetical protein
MVVVAPVAQGFQWPGNLPTLSLLLYEVGGDVGQAKQIECAEYVQRGAGSVRVNSVGDLGVYVGAVGHPAAVRGVECLGDGIQ